MLTCLLLVPEKKNLALRTQALCFPFACDFALFEILLAKDKKKMSAHR